MYDGVVLDDYKALPGIEFATGLNLGAVCIYGDLLRREGV